MDAIFDKQRRLLERARTGETAALAELDAHGFLLRGDEDAAAYAARVGDQVESQRALAGELDRTGRAQVFDDLAVTRAERIPGRLADEAGELTEALYGFRIRWAPGFFPEQGVGLFWGGCACADSETGRTLFLLRKNFAESERWFIYGRRELLAHELCHVARLPLGDDDHEEHFAYQTSTSALRRFLGGCFRRPRDAFLFALPAVVLALAVVVRTFSALSYPVWPFWAAAVLGPLWLVGVNLFARRRLARAERLLREAGIDRPGAVLYRCTGAEVREFLKAAANAGAAGAFLRERSGESLKWRVALARFGPEG